MDLLTSYTLLGTIDNLHSALTICLLRAPFAMSTGCRRRTSRVAPYERRTGCKEDDRTVEMVVSEEMIGYPNSGKKSMNYTGNINVKFARIWEL